MQGLLKDSLFTFFIRIFVMAMSLGTSIILSRVLGPSLKGSYDIIFLVINAASLLVVSGIGSSNVFYGARSPNKIPQLYVNSFFAAFGFAIIGIFATESAIFIPAVKTYFQKNGVYNLWVRYLILFLPAILLKNYLTELIRATGDIHRYNYIFLWEKIVTLAATVLIVWVLGQGLEGALKVWVISLIITTITVVWMASRFAGKQLHFDFTQFRRCFSFGMRLHPGNVAQFLNYRADIFLVGLFLGPYEVGLYVTAAMLGEKLWEIPHAIRTVLLYQVAANGKSNSLNAMLQISRLIVVFLGVICIALALFAYPLVEFLFGYRFLPSAKALIFLMPGVWALGIGKIYTSYLTGIGMPEIGTFSAVISLVATIVLDILLIPRIGIVGAAAASSVSYILASVVILSIFKRETKVSLSEMTLLRLDDLSTFQLFWDRFRHRNLSR